MALVKLLGRLLQKDGSTQSDLAVSFCPYPPLRIFHNVFVSIVEKGNFGLRRATLVLQDSLKRMMDTVILDDSAGVREEALELQRVLQLRLTPSVN